MIDFTFVNGSAPYLNAENLNSIVGSINDNESSISVLEDIVDDLTHEIVPESIVKEAVDDYVEEHSAGFATEAEVESLNESLTNKDIKSEFSFNIEMVEQWTGVRANGNMVEMTLRFTTPSTVSSDLNIVTIPTKYRPSLKYLYVGNLVEDWSGNHVGMVNIINGNLCIASNTWSTNKNCVAHLIWMI